MRINMKVERMRHELTIREVADTIGVHPNAVSRWESGDTEPTASNIIALCEIYDCTPEYLLDMTDDRMGRAVCKST